MADKSQKSDLVSECYSKNTQLLSIIFSDKIKNADVTEFLVVIQKTERILSHISQQKYYQIIDQSSLSFKIFQRSLERVDTILNEYIKSFLQILNRANSDQQMNRILNNSNLRRNIEQINSALLSEATALEEKHQYVQRELNLKQNEDNPTTNKNQISSAESTVPSASSEVVDSEVKGIIQDQEGRVMWEQKIGAKKLMAEWGQFTSVYSKCINQMLKEDQQKVLRRILDPSNTGSVSANRFAEFLKGFGPLSNSMQNVSKLLSQPWFWGFVSVEESQKYLECAAVGTFLIRFSSTKAGSFSISFTSGPSQVTHVQIAPKNESPTASGFGFAIKEEGGEKIFPSIETIVKHYSSVLTIPFKSDIPELEYFFGDLDASEAEEVLSGKETGTFLIRFSSQPGYFAGSYVDTNKQVAKCLIASKPAYFIADQEGKNYGSFKTMRELVQAFNMTFKIPYKKSTNEVNNAIRYRIANEILDTERTYLRALNTLSQIFVEPLKASTSTIPLADVHTIFSNLDEIRKIQQAFFSKLEPTISKWNDQCMIGHLFVELEQPLKSYSTYVNNFDASAKCINNHLTSKNSQFKKFIDQCLQKPECDQSSLSSYLIQPVQRIPRYILLLSDLMKNTPSGHDDYSNLEAGLAAIKRVAEHINESKRNAENFAKLLNIQSNLTSEIEKFSLTDRSLVKDGDVLEKNKKSGFSDRYILLTADSVVLLKKKKEKFTFKGLVSLRNASVEEAGSTDLKDEKVYLIQIMGTSNSLTASSEVQSVTIGVKTENEKNTWKNTIQETIDALNHPERADRELKKNISTLTLMSSNLFIGNNTTRSNSFGTPPVTRKSVSPHDIPSKRHVSLSAASTPTNLSSSPVTNPQIPSPQKSPSQNFNQQSLWKQAQTQDGRVYYYNVATRQTSWTLPADS